MLFISPDLYIDAINLILNDDSIASKDIVKTLVEIYEEDSKINSTIRNSVTKFAITMIKDILKNNIGFENKDDLLSYLLKYKNSNVLMKDEMSYSILEKMINRERRISKNKIDETKTRMQNSLLWYNLSKKSKDVLTYVNQCAIQTDLDEQNKYFDKILTTAKEIVHEFEVKKFSDDFEDLSVERIDFSSKDSIMKGIKKFKKLRSKGMPTGLKGLNRLFGKAGGPVRGESIVINALMHQFKTGMLLNFARWLVKYNTPNITDTEIKKPLILFISLENQAEQNLMELYRNAYEILYNESADGKSDEEICEYVFEYFNSNGFNLIVERKLPHTFGYDELVNLIEKYEAAGYEIYSVIIDYMNNMKKENSVNVKGARPDLLLRDLYAYVCNYTKDKNITLITAHQLNRDAQRIASSGTTNIVKRFNADHLSDGMDPQREVDCVIFIHIEEHPHSHEKFLTMMCRKHRYVHDTEDKFKYLAYKFNRFGIEDDFLLDEDYAIYDIYAKNNKSNQELAIEDLF